MQVHIEQTRAFCDHCGKVGPVFILSSEFLDKIDSSIQLCNEHAEFFANEILKNLPKASESTA